MVVVVFLLFCGLHNEAGDSKFRKGRQYIAYVGHVGALTLQSPFNPRYISAPTFLEGFDLNFHMPGHFYL